MRAPAILLTAAALAACEPPEASTATEAAPTGAEAELVESAPPGDPNVFAPPGWPLEIGDRITTKEYFTLDEGLDEGPKVPFRGGEYYSALGLIALHMVGDRVYSADFNPDPAIPR